jgi:hypothetical protein
MFQDPDINSIMKFGPTFDKDITSNWYTRQVPVRALYKNFMILKILKFNNKFDIILRKRY